MWNGGTFPLPLPSHELTHSRAAYLERKYPLRPTSSVPHPEEPVPLESIQIHASSHSRSSSLQTTGLGFPADDEKAPHRRRSSVGARAIEAMARSPLLGGQEAVGARVEAVPSVDNVVLARRVAVDQLIMCVEQRAFSSWARAASSPLLDN